LFTVFASNAQTILNSIEYACFVMTHCAWNSNALEKSRIGTKRPEEIETMHAWKYQEEI